MSKVNKMSMAALGSYDSMLPFKSIGLDDTTINEESRDAIVMLIDKIARQNFAVLFVEESIYKDNHEAIKEISEFNDISIIPVPNQRGSIGIGLASIRQNVERAVGMDIFGVK
ncbi:MAG: V-type ATP synthase subunit F [Synergistaceae bacterium]|nr:V-type ATP synthase subunit F [Synergistaceae bacterium]